MCSHQAATDRVYNQRCFWLYATETKKNIQKILKKQRPQETEWKGKRSKRTFQMTKKTRGKNKKNTDLEHGKDRTQILRYMVQAVCTHMRGGEEKTAKGKKAEVLPSIAGSDW